MGNKNCIPLDQTNFVFKTNLTVLIYNLIILATTAYIVFWKNQPGTWFILAIILMVYPNYNFCKDDNINKSSYH